MNGDSVNSTTNGGAGTVSDLTCPTCGERTETGDRFCESCGRTLDAGPPPPPAPAVGACTACGGGVGPDGYCQECGRRGPVGADHVEDELDPAEGPAAAGVSDRGHRRRRNEDAFALGRATTPDGAAATVVVVADGVASVPNGDTASRVACDVAVSAGCAALTDDPDLDAAGAHAAAAARRAVAALAPGTGAPPACTYVAAVVRAGEAVVSWVGDSRAYWLAPGGGSALLTEDDSWASEMIAAGIVGADDAFSDPRAHVITRWLAADAPEIEARSVRCRLEPGGALLLCSDGVWNHVADPAVLAAVLDPAWLPDDVAAGARALVQAALDDGGTDNATAVLLALGPAGEGG